MVSKHGISSLPWKSRPVHPRDTIGRREKPILKRFLHLKDLAFISIAFRLSSKHTALDRESR